MKSESCKMDNESSRTRRISVRLALDLYERLLILCGGKKSFSRVVNAALREWLQQKGGGA